MHQGLYNQPALPMASYACVLGYLFNPEAMTTVLSGVLLLVLS